MSDDGHVFISYSRKDGIKHAERLEAALNPHFRTWRDTRNIDPTQDFTAEIENDIKAALPIAVNYGRWLKLLGKELKNEIVC